MPDDRIEVKVPNMLAPESASGIEVEPTKEQEAADVGLQSPEEIKRPEPESSVVELPKREAYLHQKLNAIQRLRRSTKFWRQTWVALSTHYPQAIVQSLLLRVRRSPQNWLKKHT